MKRVFTNQNQFYNVKADGKHKKKQVLIHIFKDIEKGGN